MFQSILRRIFTYAEDNGNELCMADAESSYTYKETKNTVESVASVLKKFGIMRGDCVAIQCTQNSRFLICMLACNALGAIFVPIEREASPNRINEVIIETEAKLLVTNINITTEQCNVCSFAVLFSNQYGSIEEYEDVNPEDTSEILFTTGSTGKSKGIEITYDNNVALAENIAYGTQMRTGNRELIPLALSHSHSLRTFYANMYRNGAVIISDGVTNIKLIYMLLKKYMVTALDLSPSAAYILLKLTKGRFTEFNTQIDYIELGTSALTETIKNELRKQFSNVRLYNCYGSTESGRSCILNFNSPEDEPFCIGYPSINASFIVVDEMRNQICSSSQRTGLLACKGRMNMKGYWKQPELTESVFDGQYVYTNDEGYINEDGKVFYVGRHGDVINYKGIKIAPDEIEDIAKESGVAFDDCALIGEPDEGAGQVPVLILKPGNVPVDFNKLYNYLMNHIDHNKMPSKIVAFDEIPRTANGKLQRNRLSDLVKLYPEKVVHFE